MRKISLWAKNNPGKSRVSIIVIHILIIGAGIMAGKGLQDLGIVISGFLLCSALLLFISGVLYYPDKRKKHKHPVTFNFYRRQKTCDWMLAFSTFTVICFISNAPGNPVMFSGIEKSTAISSINPISAPSVIPVKQGERTFLKLNLTRVERKALVKELKQLLRESFHKQKDKDKNRASRIGLVVLTIIVGVALSILLAALACNVACNGSETAAIFVLIFGAAAIAGLMVLVIKAIHKAYPKVMESATLNDASPHT